MGIIRCAAGHPGTRSFAIGSAKDATRGAIGASFLGADNTPLEVESIPTAMEWSHKGQMLAVGYYDGSLDVFGFPKKTITLISRHKKFQRPISSISWSSDNMTIVHSSFVEGGFAFALATNAKATVKNKMAEKQVKCVSVYGSCLAIAGVTIRGEVHVWNCGTWSEVDHCTSSDVGGLSPAICKFHRTKAVLATFFSSDRDIVVNQVAIA